MLGGFGNLAGGMTFWDTQTKKKLGETQDTCTALEWSPDSRAIVCATCFPRLRVDNGFRIYNYCGELLHGEMEESKELYQVAWQQVSEQRARSPQPPSATSD
jgi:translation initiation factor 2A